MAEPDDTDARPRQWLGLSTMPGEAERRVLDHSARRRTISRDTNRRFNDTRGFGDRMADRVAAFGGSWTFIGVFVLVLVLWAGVNLALAGRAFDPYPFIFLNLMLSMLAAIQAPVIMMSQNRQAAKDRLSAQHDYEVNLKAEIEILSLHDKIDRMRADHLERILQQQRTEIELLARTIEALRLQDGGAAPAGPGA